MRIWLEKGKQKELFHREKESSGLSWNEFAKVLNVSFGRLNSWVYEENLMPEEIFNKLKLNAEYKKFIVQRLGENWGRIKGGKLSSGSTKKIKIPEKSEELAEFWGIVLGDGNVQKREGYRIGTYRVTIVGHSVLDRDYLLNFVKPLGEKLFGIDGRYFYSKFSNALFVSFNSRKIVDFFERNGFKSGNKILNQVTIPDWIKENPYFLAACLRGLHDTDGSFYKLANQNSYQIGFTNHDFKLLSDAQKALLSLGIGVSRIIGQRKYVITRKSEIAKFYKAIGFHNFKHLRKIKNADIAL
jgi:intein/homing endonuclease